MPLVPTDSRFPTDSLFPTLDPNVPYHVLLCSFEDVNTAEASRVWVDAGDKLMSWRSGGGRGSELEEMDARTWDGVLDNRDGELDPTNTGSTHAPNVVPNRMWWHRIQMSGNTYDRFKGYVDGFRPVWPEGQEFSNAEAHVRATDGTKILSQDVFTPASPDVVDYDEVLSSDEPSSYYRLGEEQGTKVVIHIHKKKKRVGKGKKRRTKVIRTRHRHRETRAEVEGISGPAGTYKNTPALGQPGAIAGDPDTAVLFREAQSEYAKIAVDQSDLIDTNQFTLEAWVNQTGAGTGNDYIISGPPFGGAGAVFALSISPTFGLTSFFLPTSGTARVSTGLPKPAANVWHHVASTWDGTTFRLYLNGGEVDSTTSVGSGVLRQGDANGFMWIGSESATLGHFDGYIDEVAVYEKALTAERIQAHYQAAALGFTAATTGGRINQVLDLQDNPWPGRNIQTGTPGTRDMPVTRYAGVQPIELIGEAVEAEGDPAMFFFDRAGIPTFLATDYRSNAPYNTPSFVFDTDGTDIPYEPGLEISDEDAFLYNDIRVTTQGGHTARATDATSIARFGRSVYTVEGASLNDADADSLAASLLARYKDPMIRVTRFQLNSLDDDAREALLSLELGDQVRVIWRPPGGGTVIDQVAHVESVELKQAEKGAPIIGTFGISPR